MCNGCVVMPTDSNTIDVRANTIPEETLPGAEAEDLIGGFAPIILQPQPRPHISPNELSNAV